MSQPEGPSAQPASQTAALAGRGEPSGSGLPQQPDSSGALASTQAEAGPGTGLERSTSQALTTRSDSCDQVLSQVGLALPLSVGPSLELPCIV